MKPKSFPLLGTWILAAVFLAILFWNSIFHDEWSSLPLELMGLIIFVCLVSSFLSAVFRRSRIYLLRLMIFMVTAGSVVPVIALGSEIHEELMLQFLPDFQQMTDQLAAKTPDFQHMDDRFAHTSTWRSATMRTPASWSWLVSDYVIVYRSEDGSFEAIYTTRDSGFLRRGLRYVTNDDPKAPWASDSYKKIAPHWYLWIWGT